MPTVMNNENSSVLPISTEDVSCLLPQDTLSSYGIHTTCFVSSIQELLSKIDLCLVRNRICASTMETLLDRLRDVATDTTIETYEFLPLTHPLIAEISARAEWLLITSNGQCNWKRLAVLAAHGFPAFPVEGGPVGWYLGGIQTPKGVITYG